VQWGADLVFKIAGKMFAVISLEETSDHCMSFKCTPEQFAELTERKGIVPAPYVARYHWVALETFNALKEKELKSLRILMTWCLRSYQRRRGYAAGTFRREKRC
jgi:predicted DNA-binding protein (MmcQ/YjbR family)